MSAPAPARPAPAAWQIALLVLAAILLVALRKSDALLNPQFWAEDGAEFFIQPDLRGWRSVVMPFVGYYHLVPRVIALTATPLPAQWIPAVYAYLSLGAVAWVVVHSCSPRLPWPAKPWIALAPFLVPHTNEVYLCLANLQWLFALVLLQLVFFDEPRDKREAVTDSAKLAVLGLTGPFVVIFLPLYGLRALRRGTRHSWILLGIAVAAAALQASALLGEPPGRAPGQPFSAELPGWLLARSLAVAFVGQAGGESLGLAGCLVVAALAAGGLVWLLHGLPVERGTAPLLGLGAALLLAAVAYKFRHEHEALRGFENGDRYFFVPKVILLWLAIFALGAGARRRAFAAALLAMALAGSLVRFRSPPLPDYGWAEQARQIEAGRQTVLRINPGPIEFLHPGRRR